ncbi:hypothetical protein FA15DRAFT_710607 [Coprinopsis marcescibilis]|uniref:Enoyl reductase (ER) domain-containing protein n=1 Tax=Coprinopsis marcescibilis TaxID=230819 RepID=A0A5C3KCQ6_COPMA|nr:hypothetical protein FA15DRAFT_710607 [Coprinopsis marcescibilis]
MDWKVQRYGLFITDCPAVIGYGIAGEVVEIGANVTNLAAGNKVIFAGEFQDTRHGSAGFQQYAIAEALTVTKIPPNVTSTQASSVPIALSATYAALYNSVPCGLEYESPMTGRGKYTRVPMIILGGSSSVGQYAIQLAKLSGFTPIVVTASYKHAEYLKSLGATDVIDRNLPADTVKAEVKAKAGKEHLGLVFDAISTAYTQQLGIDFVCSGGSLIISTIPLLKSEDKATKSAPQNIELLRTMYANLGEWLQNGDIKPNRVETLPGGLNGIPDGILD